MFWAWIEKNTLLPPGNFCNCIFRLDIGCAGLHTRSLDPNFCLCHLFNKKTKPSTTSQCSEKRSLKERIQSDSNMIQWYHTSCLTHGTFLGDDLSIGRVSFNVVKSIFLRCLSDVTSPHHTWAELCCFSCHTFFLHAFHFGMYKAMLAWKMTIFSS